jgi:hypothetical protein
VKLFGRILEIDTWLSLSSQADSTRSISLQSVNSCNDDKMVD